MPFDQKKLDRSFNQSRGIFDKYVYKSDVDTIVDIQSPGYFAESRFAGDDDWSNGIIDVQASDSFAMMQITADGQSAFSVSGSGTPIILTSITPFEGFFSKSPQNPTGLGDAGAIRVEYGAGGQTAGGEFTVAIDGLITTEAEANDPQYQFVFTLRFKRTTSPGEANMVARFLYAADGIEGNAVQVGNTFGAQADDGETIWREVFRANFKPAIGSVFWMELARDPSGADNGGLDTFQPSGDLSTWNDIPTASLTILKGSIA